LDLPYYVHDIFEENGIDFKPDPVQSCCNIFGPFGLPPTPKQPCHA
jgi:hypothetical protein